MKRIEYLDGLRGWAALTVVFYHTLFTFRVDPEVARNDTYPDLFNIGHLSVIVFFVISGFALSAQHVEQCNKKLAHSVVARYLRLAVPVFITNLVVYLIWKNGFFTAYFSAVSDKEVMESLSWMGQLYQFEPTLLTAIKSSFYDTFFLYLYPGASFNAALWTMSIELTGSFCIYGYLAIFRGSKPVSWTLICVCSLLSLYFVPLISAFFWGYLILEITRLPAVESWRNSTSFYMETLTVFIAISTGIACHFYPNKSDRVFCLIAIILFTSICFSRGLRFLFSLRISRFLGKISFPLYLIHMTVISSWTFYLHSVLTQFKINSLISSVTLVSSTLFLCVACSCLLIPVERLAIVTSKFFARTVLPNRN